MSFVFNIICVYDVKNYVCEVIKYVRKRIKPEGDN